MNFEVIKCQAYLIAFWILIIKYLQEFNIVLAVMGLTDHGAHFPSLRANPCMERQCAESFVFIIPADRTVVFIRKIL